MLKAPPPIDGVAASRLQLRAGQWPTVLDALCGHFPAIARARWLDRIARARVLDVHGMPISAQTPFRLGAEIYYYREVGAETRVAADEQVLHLDAHLLVADKPHFLPVTPGGNAVTETLLARLQRRFGDLDLAPLHRIDRDTAGLVLFSVNPQSRARYHALFKTHAINKRYQAIAPALPDVAFPHVHRSRLERGDPFFRMQEVPGIPNSETRIAVIERGRHGWRYALEPITGRTHQLRVHMAALGAAIDNDPFYPNLRSPIERERGPPLQLLACALAFVDPINGQARAFESALRLDLESSTAGDI